MSENSARELTGKGLVSFLESLGGRDYPRRSMRRLWSTFMRNGTVGTTWIKQVTPAK